MRGRLAILAIVCMVSIAAAGCGSKSNLVGPPPSTSTAPARQSTAATAPSAHTTTPRAPKPGQAPSNPPGSSSETAAFTRTALPPSTPIGSAQYHDAVVNAFQRPGRNPKAVEVFADCIQKILENAGINTVGEAAKIKQDPTSNKQVANGALQCLGSTAP